MRRANSSSAVRVAARSAVGDSDPRGSPLSYGVARRRAATRSSRDALPQHRSRNCPLPPAISNARGPPVRRAPQARRRRPETRHRRLQLATRARPPVAASAVSIAEPFTPRANVRPRREIHSQPAPRQRVAAIEGFETNQMCDSRHADPTGFGAVREQQSLRLRETQVPVPPARSEGDAERAGRTRGYRGIEASLAVTGPMGSNAGAARGPSQARLPIGSSRGVAAAGLSRRTAEPLNGVAAPRRQRRLPRSTAAAAPPAALRLGVPHPRQDAQAL